MTDTQDNVVARLRGSVTKSGGIDCRHPALLLGAADTIERLRASNKQLREALEMALDCMESAAKIQYSDWSGEATPSSAIGVARAALKDAQGDKP